MWCRVLAAAVPHVKSCMRNAESSVNLSMYARELGWAAETAGQGLARRRGSQHHVKPFVLTSMP